MPSFSGEMVGPQNVKLLANDPLMVMCSSGGSLRRVPKSDSESSALIIIYHSVDLFTNTTEFGSPSKN